MDQEITDAQQVTPNVHLGSLYCEVERFLLDRQVLRVGFGSGVRETPVVFVALVVLVQFLSHQFLHEDRDEPLPVHVPDRFQHCLHFRRVLMSMELVVPEFFHELQ